MNRPDQSRAVISLSARARIAASSATETQALDPEPAGFIILIRRWALQARTPAGPASPNTPSPTPLIRGWTISARPGSNASIARSSSAGSAQVHAAPWLTRRPSRRWAAIAGFTTAGNRCGFAGLAGATRNSGSGTGKPAAEAASHCSRLSSATCACLPRGPARIAPVPSQARSQSQTEASSSGTTAAAPQARIAARSARKHSSASCSGAAIGCIWIDPDLRRAGLLPARAKAETANPACSRLQAVSIAASASAKPIITRTCPAGTEL